MPPESYFTDDSMVRRVHREFVVGLAGPRTLLMQATHPVAFAGFFAHTGALDEPYERLARTAQVMDAIAFGPREAADRMTRRVRAMHRRVRGELSEPAAASPPARPTRPTTQSCCCGSWPRSSTPRCSSTASTSAA